MQENSLDQTGKIDKYIEEVERVLGFPLHDWQKAYLHAHPYSNVYSFNKGRRNGKSLAHMLKVMMPGGTPLKVFRRRKFPAGINWECRDVLSADIFENEWGLMKEYYATQVYNDARNLYFKLKENGVEVRDIEFADP